MTLAICFLVLFWLLASFLGLRRVLRWWYQRQATQLDYEAECIREGLLQALFAMRRSLELALLSDQPQPKEVQQWLTQMETMQHSLETVMYRLSPPYLGDSLPLAMQHLLKQWQAEHPIVCLDMDLPTHWHEDPIAQRRVLMTAVSELLRLIAPSLRSEALLAVSLTQQATAGQLVIQLTAPTVSELFTQQATALTNLLQLFQVLTDGKCYCRRQDSTAIWHYQWRSPHATMTRRTDDEPGHI